MAMEPKTYDAVPLNLGASRYLLSGRFLMLTWRLTSGELVLVLLPPVVVWVVLTFLGHARTPLIQLGPIGITYAPLPMFGIIFFAAVIISTIHCKWPHSDLFEAVMSWFAPRRYVATEHHHHQRKRRAR